MEKFTDIKLRLSLSILSYRNDRLMPHTFLNLHIPRTRSRVSVKASFLLNAHKLMSWYKGTRTSQHNLTLNRNLNITFKAIVGSLSLQARPLQNTLSNSYLSHPFILGIMRPYCFAPVIIRLLLKTYTILHAGHSFASEYVIRTPCIHLNSQKICHTNRNSLQLSCLGTPYI